MTATILSFPAIRTVPEVGDPVICTRDGKPGFVEVIIDNSIGQPGLAVVRVSGGFGARLLPFAGFRPVPTRITRSQ